MLKYFIILWAVVTAWDAWHMKKTRDKKTIAVYACLSLLALGLGILYYPHYYTFSLWNLLSKWFET